MRLSRPSSALLFTAALLIVPFNQSAAQQPPSTGTVTGHVICGDTERPARFAQVMLFGVPKNLTPPPNPTGQPNAAQMKAAIDAMGTMNIAMTQTGLDGSFTAANVAPGDYYLFASVPGYVQPSSMVQAAVDAGADLTKPLPGVPIVHVSADRSVSSDVTVARGAAISGRIVWDDGSPVSRAIVTLEPSKADGTKLPSQFGMLAMSGGIGGGGGMSISDDLGQFRLAGFAPGDYLIKATLQLNSGFSMQSGVMNMSGLISTRPLVIYAPAAFHKAAAQPITLKAGDEQRDQLITIDLSTTHSVSGQVASIEDHHGINSAQVTLTDASDKDFTRSSGVDASGNFTVTFVPPGTYNMTVAGARDTEPSQKKQTGPLRFSQDQTVRGYDEGKSSVLVTDSDVTGQNIELTPSKTTSKDVDLNQLLPQ